MGATPLHWAYFSGSPTVVNLVEQAGADPAARDDTLGCTPRAFGICAPANWGFAALVRARLAEDPSLARLVDGRTSPLHEAARSGSAEVVSLLLEHGADASRVDGEGKTPLEIASERGDEEAVELLRQAVGRGGGS
jgi:ankyrin repeat protein